MKTDTENVLNWQQNRTSAEAFFRRHRDLEAALFLDLDMAVGTDPPRSRK